MPVPSPRRPHLDPHRTYWLHELDELDPVYADQIRARIGRPPRHTKPAATPAAVKTATKKTTTKKTPPPVNFTAPDK